MNRSPSLDTSLITSIFGGAALLTLVAFGAPAAALAQAANGKATDKAATAPAKPATAPANAAGAGKAPAARPAKASNRKKAPVPPAEPEVVISAADDQQLLAAKEVYLGESGCEFDQKIQLDASPLHPGYVDMSFNKKKYMMKPVMSSTGALRLEDIRTETLMIQISNKSMLMNQKTGQRMADNCMHVNHREVAAEADQGLIRQ